MIHLKICNLFGIYIILLYYMAHKGSDFMNFYEEQLKNETKYIENNYLLFLVEYDNNVAFENDFIVKKVIFNNETYKMYLKKTSKFDILLIQESKSYNFVNDFNNIIKYKKTNNEIHFSIISKKENNINLVYYIFFANESSYSTGNYFYDSFYVKNNILQFESLKSNTSIPDFLYNFNIRKLTDSGYRLNRIKRNKN